MKCPNCGANLEKNNCEYCGYKKDAPVKPAGKGINININADGLASSIAGAAKGAADAVSGAAKGFAKGFSKYKYVIIIIAALFFIGVIVGGIFIVKAAADYSSDFDFSPDNSGQPVSSYVEITDEPKLSTSVLSTYYSTKVTGELKNISSKTISVSVYYIIYNSSGKNLGEALDIVSGLAPGGKWVFSASHMSKVTEGEPVSFKFSKFSIY